MLMCTQNTFSRNLCSTLSPEVINQHVEVAVSLEKQKEIPK